MAQISFKGNASAKPELKFFEDGTAIAKVSVAENHYRKNRQTEEWEQSGTTWWNVQARGKRAELLAEHVDKGTPLVVTGRVTSRDYEKDGERRTWTQVDADQFAIVPRDQQQSQSRAPQQGQQGGYGQPQGYGQQAPQNDPWGGMGAQGGYDAPPGF